MMSNLPFTPAGAQQVMVPAFTLSQGAIVLLPGQPRPVVCVGASPVLTDGSGLTLPGAVKSTQRDLKWVVAFALNTGGPGTTQLIAQEVAPEQGFLVLVPEDEGGQNGDHEVSTEADGA